MNKLLVAGLAMLLSCLMASAEDSGIQTILQEHQAVIAKSSRKTIGPAISAIAESGLPEAQTVLETWAAKNMWMRKSDGLFFIGKKSEHKSYELIDFDSGQSVGTFPKNELKKLKPNSGIRALIGTALVRFQLMDPDLSLGGVPVFRRPSGKPNSSMRSANRTEGLSPIRPPGREVSPI